MSELTEAFKRLEALNEDVYSLDGEGIRKLSELDSIEAEDVTDVIDPNAETEEEIKDSYEGKIILDCNCCHSKLFKDIEDVRVNEDETMANEDEECPYCYSHDGFTVLGKVAPFKEEEDVTVKVEDEDGEKDVEVEKEEKVDESLYNLKNIHDLKGFGGKATVEIGDDGKKVLYSYDTPVVEISKDKKVKLLPDWKYSMTTLRHVREFLRQEGFKAESSKQIENDYGSVDECVSNVNESIAKSVNEGIDKLEIEADGQKIKVETEPAEEHVEEKTEEEVIAPIDDEAKNEIINNSDEDEIDFDFDEFEEKDFDELGEGYLKKVYENVNSYKTNKVSLNGNKIVIEGIIKFNSGKNKKTSFIFEAHSAKKNGTVRFLGENAQITKGKKAFKLTGKIDEKKFIGESLTYRYQVSDKDGKSQKLYGTIKK